MSGRLRSGEGLWPYDGIDLPPAVRAAVASVLKVGQDIRFEVTVFRSSQTASLARSQPGARSKRFLPDGQVIWPVITDTQTLQSICSNETRARQPGFYEICNALQQGGKGDDVFLTESLQGSGTGFALRHGSGRCLVVTNYHVVREAIERTNRTEGVPQPRPERVQGTWVESESGKRAETVELHSHASEAEWKDGLDWATLIVKLSDLQAGLEFNARPLRPGEIIWVLGFPTRTIRRSPHYPEADGSLRVSTGRVIHSDDRSILAAVDGVSGNSGSPALNQQGHVVGIFRDHNHRDGEFDLRIGHYNGEAQIVPTCRLPETLRHPQRAT